jgi:DNA-binding transcriptional MocR family regulator
MVTPGGEVADRVAQSLRAASLMPSPLATAVVTSWIREGAAEALLVGVRGEARARRALAAELLPAAKGAPEGIHVWLDLPDSWEPDRLRLAAEQRGLSLVTADAFATGPSWPNGVRISLGGPTRQSVLRAALQNMADLLKGVDAPRQMVV